MDKQKLESERDLQGKDAVDLGVAGATTELEDTDCLMLSTTSTFRALAFHDNGGRGEIYRAEQADLRRVVAIKCLKGDSAEDPVLAARFRFEAEATSQLDHPGVAPVYGIGEMPDGRIFYTMRFIRGGNLEKEIDAFHRRCWKPGEDGERHMAFNALVRHLIS